MKVCPECKSRCFDDMEICYGCMHKFTDKEVKNDLSSELLPEYFELDSCPIIEEIDEFYERKEAKAEVKKDIERIKPNHAKEKINRKESIVLKIEIPTQILKDSLK